MALTIMMIVAELYHIFRTRTTGVTLTGWWSYWLAYWPLDSHTSWWDWLWFSLYYSWLILGYCFSHGKAGSVAFEWCGEDRMLLGVRGGSPLFLSFYIHSFVLQQILKALLGKVIQRTVLKPLNDFFDKLFSRRCECFSFIVIIVIDNIYMHMQ